MCPDSQRFESQCFETQQQQKLQVPCSYKSQGFCLQASGGVKRRGGTILRTFQHSLDDAEKEEILLWRSWKPFENDPDMPPAVFKIVQFSAVAATVFIVPCKIRVYLRPHNARFPCVQKSLANGDFLCE